MSPNIKRDRPDFNLFSYLGGTELIFHILNMKLATSLCILWLAGVSSKQHLSFTKTQAKLPFPRDAAGAIYDGDDSIYIFGGTYGYMWATEEVLKYTISTDQIQVVAKLPYVAIFLSNTVSINSLGKIHTFLSGDVYEFDPLTNDIKIVSSMDLWMGPFVQISRDIGLILFPERSSYPLSVVQFDLRTMNATVLSQDIPKEIRLTAAAFDKKNSVVYCPGYNVSNNYAGIVARFDVITNKFSVIATDLPGHRNPSGAVWKNGKMYVISGSYSAKDEQRVAEFDPTDLSYKFLPVAGLNWTVVAPIYQAMAYVEKLKRIYVFGGSKGETYFDSVGYFKFGRSNEMDVETDEHRSFCSEMHDGFYAKPGSPTTYISCMSEEMVEQECSDSLVFDPELLTCH